MADSVEEPRSERPLRADARRNRERLLAAAAAVFARGGGDAAMETVAKEAGVGIGTLYRHFPTRAALVDAVYAEALDELEVAARRAESAASPVGALASFLEGLAGLLAARPLLAAALDPAAPATATKASLRIRDAVATVLGHAQAAGSARRDVGADDVTRLVVAAAASDAPARLLAVVLAGLRPER